MHIEENNLEFNFDGGDPTVETPKSKLHTFKLTSEQKLTLLQSGYTQKDCEEMVLKDIPNAVTLKICFSEKEVLEWMEKRYPRKLSVDEVFTWWKQNAKRKYQGVQNGLYVEYLKRRAKRKPLIMYKEMAVDNKPHKIY